MSLRRRQLVNRATSGFTPTSLGVVGAWLRNNTVGAISSVTDQLNTNPATQSDTDRQPTGEADGSVTFDGSDVLVWPLVADQNKNTTALGFAFWFEPAEVATTQRLLVIDSGTGGASVRTIVIEASGEAIRFWVGNNGLIGRRATIGGVLSVGTPIFITCEFNGDMESEETRHVVTLNGAVQLLSFAALSGGVSDTVLNDPTGNILIGGTSDEDVVGSPISEGGRMGKNVAFAIIGAMPGATEGQLTEDARLNLMALEPLT